MSKRHTIILNKGDEYAPGCLEVLVEGEKFGGGQARTVGFGAATIQWLDELLKDYPAARLIGFTRESLEEAQS